MCSFPATGTSRLFRIRTMVIPGKYNILSLTRAEDNFITLFSAGKLLTSRILVQLQSEANGMDSKIVAGIYSPIEWWRLSLDSLRGKVDCFCDKLLTTYPEVDTDTNKC